MYLFKKQMLKKVIEKEKKKHGKNSLIEWMMIFEEVRKCFIFSYFLLF